MKCSHLCSVIVVHCVLIWWCLLINQLMAVLQLCPGTVHVHSMSDSIILCYSYGRCRWLIPWVKRLFLLYLLSGKNILITTAMPYVALWNWLYRNFIVNWPIKQQLFIFLFKHILWHSMLGRNRSGFHFYQVYYVLQLLLVLHGIILCDWKIHLTFTTSV